MKLSLALTAVFLPIIVNAATTTGSSASGGNATTTVASNATSTVASNATSTVASTAAVASASSTPIPVVVSPFGVVLFNPSNVTATTGTEIVFTWNHTSVFHTVTESTLFEPCTPVQGGFSSGLLQEGQFTITVTNESIPTYIMCGYLKHCSAGMVFALNAPDNGTGSFSDLLGRALAIGSNEAPVTNDSAATGGVGGATASALPSGTSASSASSSTSTSTSKSSDAGRLVASGIFALLATALGITLA